MDGLNPFYLIAKLTEELEPPWVSEPLEEPVLPEELEPPWVSEPLEESQSAERPRT
jgi:hypothetical protein